MQPLANIEKLAARAALDPLVLPEMIWTARTAMGGVMGVVERIDKRTGQVEILATDEPGQLVEGRDAYEQYFSRINPRNVLVRDYPSGFIHTDDLIGDDRALEANEFYVDFLGKNGLRYFTGAVVIDDSEQMVLASVQRGVGQERTDEADKALFARLIPILGNSLAWHNRLRGLPQAPVLADLLDMVAEPVAVLTGKGRLLFANGTMRAMFGEDGALRLFEGRLEPTNPPARRALDRLLKAVKRGRRSACEALPVRGRVRPIMLRAVRMTDDHARQFDRNGPVIGLFIDDPDRPLTADVQRIARTLGLTRMEAVVGAHLAAGWTIAETALKLGISRNTVRTHVARLREKLGERSMLGVAARLRSASAALH